MVPFGQCYHFNIWSWLFISFFFLLPIMPVWMYLNILGVRNWTKYRGVAHIMGVRCCWISFLNIRGGWSHSGVMDKTSWQFNKWWNRRSTGLIRIRKLMLSRFQFCDAIGELDWIETTDWGRRIRETPKTALIRSSHYENQPSNDRWARSQARIVFVCIRA